MISRLQKEGQVVDFAAKRLELNEASDLDVLADDFTLPERPTHKTGEPNEPSRTKTSKEQPNESEMKAALKNLVNLHANQRKTNELVYELSSIKDTLRSELRNMAETEVIAYQAAAISKLNKIKELLENKNI